MKKIILLLPMTLFLAACQPKLEECWAPETKASIDSLIKRNLINDIDKAINAANGKSFSKEDQDFYQRALAVKTDTYHAIDRSFFNESLTCGTNVSMKLTRTDNSTMEAGDAGIEFKIYKAENGKVFSIDNTLPLRGLIERAK